MVQYKVIFLLTLVMVACTTKQPPAIPEVWFYDAAQELTTALHEVFAARWPTDSITLKKGTPDDFFQNPHIRQLWFVDVPIITIPEKDAQGYTFTHIIYATDAWVFVSKKKLDALQWIDGTPVLPTEGSRFLLLHHAASSYFGKQQNVSVSTDADAWLNMLHSDALAVGVCLRSDYMANKRFGDLQILPINQINQKIFATAETIENGTYPMLAAMHVLQRVQRHDASVLFLDFSLSPPGRLLCTKQGWLPQQLAERKLRFYK